MYSLADLHSSEKLKINSDSAIVFIINNNIGYFNFLKTSIYNIVSLHDVNIYILCLSCKTEIEKLLKPLNNNKIHILDIEFPKHLQDLEIKFLHRQYEFQYIKPIALDFLISKTNNKVKNLLYLDADTFPIRNLKHLFKEINQKLLIIKEFGIDYNKLGYEKYVNSLSIYNYFDSIAQQDRWGRREPPVNTGVIGFEIPRDKEFIDTWTNVTTRILRENLRPLIRWWDQGCFMLTLEILKSKHIVSNNQSYNHTILHKNITDNTIQNTDSNILHFIGDNKINILRMIKPETVDSSFLEIAIAGHAPEQFFSIHPRSYLQYKVLPELEYDKPIYRENSLGESRIFLANNIFRESSDVIGTVTPSWNKKYYPNKIDHILNWPQFPLIQQIRQDPSLVVCSTICAGAYAKSYDPLWTKNFQIHFRNEFKNSEWVEQKLFDITGLRYDGIRPAPYANQIICHKTVFYDLCAFFKQHIDAIINEFTLKPNYSTPDPNRPLAYILEELSMLWWSSRKGIQLVPVVEIQPNWYKK